MNVKMLLGGALILLAKTSLAVAVEPLDAFPAAEDGMTRFVITLPQKERGEEESFKVEIIVGREMLTDGVNQLQLGNVIEPRTLKGWGYSYYMVTGSSSVLSTLMAAPEGEEKVKQFVSAPSVQVRYNSRLPIVVYVPDGFEVRYRIWQASEEKSAEKK
jgi:ecotin